MKRKLYRWLARTSHCWIDTITDIDDDGPTFRFSRWPGDDIPFRLPFELICANAASSVLSVLHQNIDRDGLFRSTWHDGAAHEFVLHSSISQLDDVRYLKVAPNHSPIMLSEAIGSIIKRRLYSYYPQARRRFPLGKVLEGSLDRLSIARAEVRARQTLRRMLGDKLYNRYQRDGFISVYGKSGKLYNLTGGKRHMLVWKDGQIVDRICIEIKESFAPTDQLIFRWLWLHDDEDKFNRIANHFTDRIVQKGEPKRHWAVECGPLTEIVANLKSVMRSPLATAADRRKLLKEHSERAKKIYDYLLASAGELVEEEEVEEEDPNKDENQPDTSDEIDVLEPEFKDNEQPPEASKTGEEVQVPDGHTLAVEAVAEAAAESEEDDRKTPIEVHEANIRVIEKTLDFVQDNADGSVIVTLAQLDVLQNDLHSTHFGRELATVVNQSDEEDARSKP